MKHILTKQNPDGSWDEVGMNNRSIIRCSLTRAFLTAQHTAKNSKRAVRLQTWRDEAFYRDEKPFTVEIVEPR